MPKSDEQMKQIHNNYLKYFVIGIFLLLLFIVYRLYNPESNVPKTELDCLKLGSDKRAEACLELLKQDKPPEEFPISYLTVENVDVKDTGSSIIVKGTVSNTYTQPAQNIELKIDFIKTQYGEQFHYETFSPFQSEGEQIQPNSKKTFSKYLRRQSSNAVNSVKDWYFSVTPFSAKIYEKE